MKDGALLSFIHTLGEGDGVSDLDVVAKPVQRNSRLGVLSRSQLLRPHVADISELVNDLERFSVDANNHSDCLLALSNRKVRLANTHIQEKEEKKKKEKKKEEEEEPLTQG